LKGVPRGDRLALIGCGAAAEKIHLPSLRRIRWAPVLFVDPNIDRARSLASGHAAACDLDYAGHLEEFDAALVLTPHSLHAPIACALLEKGKAVFVEKPMAVNGAEATLMVDTAAAAGGTIAVGLMRRQLRAAGWVKAFLESRLLGTIESFDIHDGFVYEWMVATDAIWRKDQAGGGVLMDIGPHVLDLLLWWLGPARDVAYQDDSYGGVEADCLIDLTMESGARGTVEMSRTRRLRQTAIIRGERGLIEVGIDSNLLRAEPSELLDMRFDGVRGGAMKRQTSDELFDAQLRSWRRALLSGEDPEVSGRDAALSIDLIERCYRARRPWELPWVRLGTDA
jgi:predicted dehydrogenase